MITLGEKLALGSLEKVTGLAKQLPKGLGVTQEFFQTMQAWRSQPQRASFHIIVEEIRGSV